MGVPKKYCGIFPAFYACYDDAGNISRSRASLLAEYYLQLGLDGLYVAGSSGECVLHTVEERKATLEAVMEAVGGKMTVIAHIAAPATRDSIALAQHAEKLGADAIAMLPGFYYGLNDATVKQYWTDVLDATDHIPMIIYNIPGTSNGYNLSTGLFEQMLQTGRVDGVKNSSGSVLDILRFRAAGGDEIAVFNGPDEQYLAGRMMGASGGIGATYGYMPELYMKLEQLIQAGKTDSATQLQMEITALINMNFTVSSLYAGAKGVLKRRGIDIGSVRAPFLPLREKDDEIIQAMHDKMQELITRF